MSTVTYAYPVSGNTAPTAVQAFNSNMLTANVVMVDADTTAVLTHNWNLSTAQLANLWPTIQYYAGVAGTVVPILSFALTNSVSVTMTKVSASGSNGTYVVILMRPHSLIT